MSISENTVKIKTQIISAQPTYLTKESYTPHVSIRINNDSDFESQFSNRTIWGLEVNGTGNGCCIYIGNCTKPFTVQNCYLHNTTGKDSVMYFYNAGIFIWKSSNITITQVMCISNSIGIISGGSSNQNITNNNCSFNLKNGIDIAGCLKCNVTSNSCCFNGFDGLNGHGDNLLLNNNNCSNNGESGITLTESSTHNMIINNTCFSNYHDGIDLTYNSSHNILMYNNLISNKHYGTNISEQSQYNSIYNNNFLFNNYTTYVPHLKKIQAHDERGKSFWNSTTEGNYWSDWTAPDFNHDSIVDNAYNITYNGSVQDHLPQVNPVTMVSPVIHEPTTIYIITVCVFGLSIIAGIRKRHF